MNQSLIVTNIALILIVADIGFDMFVRHRFRPGHAQGAVARVLGWVGMGWWILWRHQVEPQFGMILLLSAVLTFLCAGVLIDRNDIADQETGLMSKSGDWWGRWDNYFCKKLDLGINYVLIPVVAGALIITILGSHTLTDIIDDRPSCRTIASSNAVSHAKVVKSSGAEADKHHRNRGLAASRAKKPPYCWKEVVNGGH